MLGPWPCSLRTPTTTTRSSVRGDSRGWPRWRTSRGGTKDRDQTLQVLPRLPGGRFLPTRPSELRVFCRTGFALVPRLLYFSSGPQCPVQRRLQDLPCLHPDLFSWKPPGFPRIFPGLLGHTVENPDTRDPGSFFIPLLWVSSPGGRERQGGREGEREGLLTGPTAALPLEGASPRFYPERHHQKPVPNEVLPN